MSNKVSDILFIIEQLKLYLLEKNRQKQNSSSNEINIFSKADDSEQLLIRIDDALSQIAQNPNQYKTGLLLDLISHLIMLVVLRTQAEQPKDNQAEINNPELSQEVSNG